MAASHILRVPATNGPEDFILVRATHTGTSRALDLKLVATDSDKAYVFQLKQKQISKLKTEKCKYSEKEWAHILKSIFLGQQPIENIEASAIVKNIDKSILIHIKKRVEDISSTLGTLILPYDEHETNNTVSLFDWCDEAVKAQGGLRKDLADATGKAAKLEDDVSALKAQLDKLIEAKAKDESERLAWMRDLINEKKVAIRTYKKILATANVDPEKLTAANAEAKSNRAARGAGVAQMGKKRKAKGEPASSEGDENDDGMEVDHDEDKISDDPGEETGSETESEAESQPDEIVPFPTAATTRGGAKSSWSRASGTSKGIGKLPAAEDDDVDEPKSLPLNRSKPAVPPIIDDDETASEDDEEL